MVKKIQIGFTAQNLTNVSGIYPVLVFMNKLGLNKIIDTHFPGQNHVNVGIGFSQIIYGIICGIIGGANRMRKIETLTADPLFKNALSLKGRIPDSTIQSRIENIKAKEAYEMNEINGILSRKVHKKIKVRREIVDCDSTVKTVYGNQEGAEVGYNPEKQGRKSYHALLAFLGSTHECLLSYLRPGNAYTANNGSEFIRHIAGIIYQSFKKLVFRMDSGFFDGAIMDAIEEIPNALFLIKVKMRNLLEFLSKRRWLPVRNRESWEQTEFIYRAHGWEKPRRIVAVRKLIRIEKDNLLFEKLVYEYFCYCTNLRLSPYKAHQFYGDRGNCENWIEAIKNQMFAGMILTKSFWVNDFLWNCSVLAYNVSIWLRYLADRKSYREEPETFRLWFVKSAGKVLHGHNQLRLELSECFLEKERWSYFNNRINNLLL